MYNKSSSHRNSLKVQYGNTFNIGDRVQKGGMYVCVPCGYKKQFKKGDVFPRCFVCLEGKKYKGDDYFKDLGLWEFLGDK